MDRGRRKNQIILKRKLATRDDKGGEVISYPSVVTVAAKATYVRGRQYEALQMAQSDTEITFNIDYRDDIQIDWRVEWRGQDYEITEPPIDVYSNKSEMELMCQTAQT